MEMATNNGEWNIEMSTGEDALGNGDTEPVLEISRRTAASAGQDQQCEWQHAGLFSADQIIAALGLDQKA